MTLKEKRLINLYRLLTVAALASTICAGAYAAAMYSPGLNTIDLQITVPAGAFVSGFDVLPNGHYLINDGRAIREVSPTGSVALYTFGSPVWGTFVRYNPADGKVYFGESSRGDVFAFSYTSPSDAAFVANIPNNFDMDFRDGRPYLVASNAFWTESSICLLGETGSDLIATSDGPSGPLAFDSDGSLIYIPASYGPTTQIIRWSSAQVADAIGAGALARADAAVLTAIEGSYGSAFIDGRLMFTNNAVTPNAIQIYDGGAVSTFATFVQPGALYPFVSLVRKNPATGAVCALVSYYDSNWNSYTVISQITVPEPSSAAALCSLIGLAASAKLLRGRRK